MLRIALSLFLLVGVAASAEQPPRASEKADQSRACFEAYEATQAGRRDGRLMEAREAAIVCAADVCPKTLSRDCVKWVGDLQSMIPGLVFDVRLADGTNVTEVNVSLDGKPMLERVDGKSVPVDPGEHMLRFEARDYLPVDARVVSLEGDKARKVQVTMKKPEPVAIAQPTLRLHRPVPLVTWVFGGVAAIGLGASGALSLSGIVARDGLGSCKPNCEPSRVVAISRLFGLADGFLIASAVAAGAALFTFFTRPELPVTVAFVPGASPGVVVTARWP
jgi:hypothetical protein